MADNPKGKFPGHDEGTVRPTNANFVKTPATYAPLSQTADGVNVKTSLGNTGKAS
jgi:hypothetical protein